MGLIKETVLVVVIVSGRNGEITLYIFNGLMNNSPPLPFSFQMLILVS